MMPSKSKAQHNLMAAVAHSAAFAKKVGIPQSVGKDFNEADKGRKFSRGGDMKKHEKHMATGGTPDPRAVAALMAARRAAPRQPAPMPPMAGAMPPPGMKHGGLSKVHHKHLAEHHLSMAEHHMQMHSHGGKVKKMAAGGPAMDREIEAGEHHLKHGEHAVQKRGHTRDIEEKMKNDGLNDVGTSGMKRGGKVHKYAAGGHIHSAHHRADGIAEKGHTKTKVHKMAGGGKAKYC
jgi:hypothetical protein